MYKKHDVKVVPQYTREHITMMKKKFFFVTCLFIFIFILSATPSPVLAHVYHDDDGVRVKIIIDDVYYFDADSDGAEDDVVVHFTLDINFEGWYLYKLEAELELPSGVVYKHKFYTYEIPSNYSVLFMYNHATEPEWYIIKLECTVYANYDKFRIQDSLVFDPPKGIGGTEPLTTKLFM